MRNGGRYDALGSHTPSLESLTMDNRRQQMPGEKFLRLRSLLRRRFRAVSLLPGLDAGVRLAGGAFQVF